MYRNLLAEMLRNGISKKNLANELNISEKALYNRFSGLTDFNWKEVVTIKKVLNTEISSDELFENVD